MVRRDRKKRPPALRIFLALCLASITARIASDETTALEKGIERCGR